MVKKIRNKKRILNKRNTKIQNGHKNTELLELRNTITHQRARRIARKLARLSCVSRVSQEYLAMDNHIINGDFELHKVDTTKKSWDYYSQSQTPGWRIMSLTGLSCEDSKLNNKKASGAIELQTLNTRVATGASGFQYAELDSHCASKKGKDARVRIFQRVETIVGKTYTVSFLAAARDNIGILNFQAQDMRTKQFNLDVSLSIDNNDVNLRLKNKDFKRYSFTFIATANLTEISFADLDQRKSTFGVLLDDIQMIGN